jgi:hypothetical protein
MPAKQQRFSMDSDDEDNEDEEQSDRDASLEPEPELAQQEESQPTVGRTNERAAARVRIAPVARVADDELRIWGPDGPVDRGDDTLFRTVGEWMTTVAPIVSLGPARADAEACCRAIPLIPPYALILFFSSAQLHS